MINFIFHGITELHQYRRQAGLNANFYLTIEYVYSILFVSKLYELVVWTINRQANVFMLWT